MNSRLVKINFWLKDNSLAEIKRLDDNQYLEYIFHRYRYEIFPLSQEIDDFPPCLQMGNPHRFVIIDVFFVFDKRKSFTKKKMVLWALCN